jgi:hypothetical protein
MTEPPFPAHRRGRGPDPATWRRLAVGRRLRILTGVNEGILDRVPLERTHYTGLGGVVLGTSMIAGLAMWFFLAQVLDGHHLWALPLVVAWALIVLNIDRWLVSKSSGMWTRRLLMLVPRLLLAVVLGIIVAEPMVLRVFETAVEQHIVDERAEARSALRAKLVSCNQPPSGTPAPASCGADSLLLSDTPVESVRELKGAENAVKKEEQALAALNTRHARMNESAKNECAGEEGDGLSGRIGKGPRCYRLYADADRFARVNRIEERVAALDRDKTRVEQLSRRLATEENDFQGRIDTAIALRVAELPLPTAPIGLLERMGALHEITDRNGFLLTATWLFRLFLILVDCLPVLVKLMGGATVYDRLVEAENESRKRVYDETLRNREHAELGDLRLERERKAEELRRQSQDLQLDRQRDTAHARSRIEDLIKERQADLLGRPKSMSNGSFHSFEA